MSISVENSSFKSPDDGKFEVGEVYYELYSDFYVRGRKSVPAIRMWVFDGYIERRCSSGGCSRGFQFSPFNDGWPDDWVPPAQGPLLYREETFWLAEQKYLTWEEFAKAVADFDAPKLDDSC